jgi:hypothetical protein
VNLRYLGDALDHWKGSLLEYLQEEGVLRELAIDPMITDLARWGDADFDLYARLLRIDRNRILQHTSAGSAVCPDTDLFLDPDTGIATGLVRSPQHISVSEIVGLLDRHPARVLAVYQHVSRQVTSERVHACITAVAKQAKNLTWCSYESATVAMIFFSRDGERIRRISDVLGAMLGRHANCRVQCGLARRLRAVS